MFVSISIRYLSYALPVSEFSLQFFFSFFPRCVLKFRIKYAEIPLFLVLSASILGFVFVFKTLSRVLFHETFPPVPEA